MIEPFNELSTILSSKIEIQSFTLRVLSEDWLPDENSALWQRLEVPGQPMNGSYETGRFDAKELYNPDGERIISHHQRLLSRKERYAAAFVAEHFISQYMKEATQPKILEVGCWPMKNYIVATQFDTTMLAILSQKYKHVVGVDNIDIKTAFPYKSYTPPYFGESEFINADFLKPETQDKIVNRLNGRPTVIIGNMVFEKNITLWENNRQLNNNFHFLGPTYKDFRLTNPNALGDEGKLAERLAYSANLLLEDKGILIVSNSNDSGVEQLPEFINGMPLLAVYMDEQNRRVFAQVYGKKH